MKTTKVVVVIITLLFFFSCGKSNKPTEYNGIIEGYVYEPILVKGKNLKILVSEKNMTFENYQPLNNAKVYLQGTSLENTTKEDGYFKIENIPKGSYVLIIEANGYTNTTININVESGKTQTLDTTQTIIYPQGNYFPLDVGNWWEYEINESLDTTTAIGIGKVEVLSADNIKGKNIVVNNLTKIKVYNKKIWNTATYLTEEMTNYYYLIWEENYLRNYADESWPDYELTFYAVPGYILKLPLQVNNTWETEEIFLSYRFKSNDIKIKQGKYLYKKKFNELFGTFTAQVSNKETITTKLGNFDCYKIEYLPTNSFGATYTSWYAPIGKVKEEQFIDKIEKWEEDNTCTDLTNPNCAFDGYTYYRFIGYSTDTSTWLLTNYSLQIPTTSTVKVN